MTGVRVPKKLGLHRQAAIALYRALLSQCRAVPLEEPQRSALQNIVRNRFRANRELRAHRAIKLCFTAGYTAIDHLDSSVAGNVESTEHIASYLSKIPERLKQPPLRIKPAEPEPDPRLRLLEPPPEHKFLNVFPRAKVEGTRKVPHLVSYMSDLVFVRWKKPQPENLGRVLRQIREQNEKRLAYSRILEGYFIPLAQYEEDWDNILVEEFGKGAIREIEPSGVPPMNECHAEVLSKNSIRFKKTRELAEKMMDIVSKEKELAVKEKEERKRVAWEKKVAKKFGVAGVKSTEVETEEDALSAFEQNNLEEVAGT